MVIKCVLKKLLIEIASSIVVSSAAIEIRACWLQHVLSGKACAGKKVASDRFKRCRIFLFSFYLHEN